MCDAFFEGKEKSGASIDLRFSPDATAVAEDHPLDDRQTDARSFKILCAVESLENSEEFVDIFHIKSGAIIADKNHGRAIFIG